MLKLNKLSAAVRELNDVISAWNDTPDENLMHHWRGRQVAVVSQAIHVMLDDLFRMVEGDAEVLARPVVLAIDRVDEEYVRWLEQVDIDPDLTDPSGTRELWGRWQVVVDELDAAERQYPLPEPIESLLHTGVGDAQIAEIYGWPREDARKVREERDNPGTHFNPKTWQHPSLVRRLKACEEAWAGRTKAERYRPLRPEDRQPAPETLEELIEQGVPSKQIAEMKGVTIDAVKAAAVRLGIPLDGTYVRSVSGADQMADIRNQEAQQAAAAQKAMQAGSAKSITDRINELASVGTSAEEIAQIVAKENPRVAAGKIKTLIDGALASTGV